MAPGLQVCVLSNSGPTSAVRVLELARRNRYLTIFLRDALRQYLWNERFVSSGRRTKVVSQMMVGRVWKAHRKAQLQFSDR